MACEGNRRAPSVGERAVVTTIYASAVVKLEEFDPKNDLVSSYIERAQLYFDANNVLEDKKVATFSSVVGKTKYQIIKNLVMPAMPRDKSLTDIVTVMKVHYEPKLLVISKRFNFNRQQGPRETIAEYVSQLRRLSEHCKFGMRP